MNPLIIPCSQKVNCPGTDNPFANLTMEAADSEIFIGVNFGPTNTPPPLGWSWRNPRGFSFCGSFVSQEVADLCAGRQALEDQVDRPPGDPDGGDWRDPNGNPPVIYSNTVQFGNAFCGDGTIFTYQVAAGLFEALSQAEADAAAASYAQTLAQVNRVCIGTFDQSGCIGQAYNSDVVITGRGPFTFSVVGGALPPGLQLVGTGAPANVLVLFGTPVLAGTYTFTVRVVGPTGNFQQKTFTVIVWGFASGGTLPEFTVGSPYSYQFLGTGGTPPYTFQTATATDEQIIEDAGLTLSSSGLLSGTPTDSGSINFSVIISDSTP